MDQIYPKALKLTLISYRQNLTQEALAQFFEVSHRSISQTISTIEKALTALAQPLKENLKPPGSLALNGALVLIWKWLSLAKTNFSVTHKRAGFSHQVIWV